MPGGGTSKDVSGKLYTGTSQAKKKSSCLIIQIGRAPCLCEVFRHAQPACPFSALSDLILPPKKKITCPLVDDVAYSISREGLIAEVMSVH